MLTYVCTILPRRMRDIQSTLGRKLKHQLSPIAYMLTKYWPASCLLSWLAERLMACLPAGYLFTCLKMLRIRPVVEKKVLGVYEGKRLVQTEKGIYV